MSTLQTNYHFKLDFQKVDQYTRGKWLINGIKCCNDNQLQSLEIPSRISQYECKHNIMESEGDKFYPPFKANVRGRNIQGVA